MAVTPSGPPTELRIGIIGASGQIGRRIPAALGSLLAADPRSPSVADGRHTVAPAPPSSLITVILATRRPAAAPGLSDGLPQLRIGHAVVDLADHDQLARFAGAVDVVVNATGPSHRNAATSASIVLASGTDYVDVGGPVGEAEYPEPITGRTALFHAGALPGAAGVLPRWLLNRHRGATNLTVICGGRGSFTRAGAEDYLAGVKYGDVEPLAAWRNSGRVRGVAERRLDVSLSEFPDPVALFPYLDADAEHIAGTYHIADGTWYSAMVGAGITDTLMMATGMELGPGSELLRDSSIAMLAGRARYVIVLASTDGGKAMLRAPGEEAMAAEMAAVATVELLAGRVQPGIFPAARALDPEYAVSALTRPGSGCVLTTGSQQPADLMDEGAL